jgi:hypothetical protein
MSRQRRLRVYSVSMALHTILLVGCGGGASTVPSQPLPATPVTPVSPATPPPPAAPSVSISASPQSVARGSAATISWTSSDATQCSASGAWAGAQPVSGTQTTGALSSTSSYTLTCTGPGGSANGSATVTVTGSASCPANPPTGLPSGVLTRNPGNPLLRNGPELFDIEKAGPRVVLKEGATTYRMWYEAVGSNGITSIAYATSSDGLTWIKRGTLMSPGGLSTWEKNEVSPGSILFEDGVYKLWYHGGGFVAAGSTNRLGNARIGYATSPDGLTWTKHANNPVLDVGPAGSFEDDQVAEPRIVKLGTGYRLYYTGANVASRLKSLGVAASVDGITWTKDARNPILDSNRWGNFWGGAFFFENGIWQLWHAVEGGAGQIQYKWSLDGIAWTAGIQQPVLTVASVVNGPDTVFLGDSVSGYRDGSFYRILYTGFAQNLFGSFGRFEGINMASIMATCPLGSASTSAILGVPAAPVDGGP